MFTYWLINFVWKTKSEYFMNLFFKLTHHEKLIHPILSQFQISSGNKETSLYQYYTLLKYHLKLKTIFYSTWKIHDSQLTFLELIDFLQALNDASSSLNTSWTHRSSCNVAHRVVFATVSDWFLRYWSSVWYFLIFVITPCRIHLFSS